MFYVINALGVCICEEACELVARRIAEEIGGWYIDATEFDVHQQVNIKQKIKKSVDKSK